MNKKTTNLVALIILDGFGIAPKSATNAVSEAYKPFYDSIYKKYPHNQLDASALAVGLPRGQMGNSEVGHLTLGSGRIINQSLTRVNLAVEDGSFFSNEAYLNAITHAKMFNSKIHLMGLISDGGVHSELEHFKAFYDLFKKHNVLDKVYLHCFLDGRDTPQTSGYNYVKTLIDYGFKVATVSGRYYAMDRDSNFDRIQKAYDNMVNKTSTKDALEGIKESYSSNVTDEFVLPFKVDNAGIVENNDSMIFANFRPDRAIRIATCFSNPEAIATYYRPDKPTINLINFKNLFFVSTMHYADTVKGLIAFHNDSFENLLGSVISKNHLKQLRIAETEKYAHVTFFFDGLEDKEIEGSKRVLVPSPKVPTYDLKPEMSAYEVASKAADEIKNNDYSLMVLNFANPDMVGHTGILNAAIKAIEAVDECLKTVVEAVLAKDGVCIIIADHGNSEQMVDELGNPQTAHTTNPVPIIITKKGIKIKDSKGLKDVAPTILDLLGIAKPLEMTGESVII
ncbi:MAG: 2,3-bisphosphoglycerate-independent phosphoglycerate mutase [Acholeplasmatales bacterium]|nr:2,3-bisphosphoglycerate-independent phosphoglycerate mutase [Acholeplasmatales bacterium]